MPRKQKTKSKKQRATKQKQKQKQSVNVKVHIDQSQKSHSLRRAPSITGGSHTTFLPAHVNQPVQQPPTHAPPFRENIPTTGFVSSPQRVDLTNLHDTVPDYGQVSNGSIHTEETDIFPSPHTVRTEPFEPPRREAGGFEGVPVGTGWVDDVSVLSDAVPDYPVVVNGSVHTHETHPHDFRSVDSNLSGYFDVPVFDDYSLDSDQSRISAGQVLLEHRRFINELAQRRREIDEMNRFVEDVRQQNDLASVASSGGGTIASTMSPNAVRLATHAGVMEQHRLAGLARGRQTQREQAEARRQQTHQARLARLEQAVQEDEEDDEHPVQPIFSFA